ncbi:Elicitor peptide [Sesbania bispinosa]|nr:Elicitor peptide [Sesbania bispinosa]
MEGPSAKKEEKTISFYVHHPCCFLQQALRALFRCFGVETETNMASQAKEEETPLLKGTCPIETPEDPATSNQKSYQEVADPPSKTTQTLDASAMARGGNRRSGISHGSPGQHN